MDVSVDHFSCLVDGIAANPESILTELVLNRNINTERGLHLLIQSLLSQESIMRRLEAFNGVRASRLSSNLILEQLRGNHTVHHFRTNLRHEYRSQIDFLLLLNRCGRKVVLDAASSPDEILEVFSAAAKLDDMSVLMYFLQANPSLLERKECNAPSSVTVEPMQIAEATKVLNNTKQQSWKTMSLIRSGWWNVKR